MPPLPKAAALIGAIAQLGERLNGIQEVRGSTPLGSTTHFFCALRLRRPRRERRTTGRYSAQQVVRDGGVLA
jgi:hypothetical protein